jgi:hypothetical protein
MKTQIKETVEIINKTIEVEVKTKKLILELTAAEAYVLRRMLEYMGGLPETSLRKISEKMFTELVSNIRFKNVDESRNVIEMKNGYPVFINNSIDIVKNISFA